MVLAVGPSGTGGLWAKEREGVGVLGTGLPIVRAGGNTIGGGDVLPHTLRQRKEG